MSERNNPFGDLGEFAPKTAPKPKPVEPELIEQLAEANNFPSRQPARTKGEAKLAPAAAPAQPARIQRRYTTGRNRQINLKVTTETAERFYQAAEAHGKSQAELFELAVELLEKAAPPNR